MYVCVYIYVCVCVCVYTVIKRMKFQIREPGLKHSPVLGSCVIISVTSSITSFLAPFFFFLAIPCSMWGLGWIETRPPVLEAQCLNY